MTIDPIIADLKQAFPPHPIDASSVFAESGEVYPDAGRFKAEVHGRLWIELSPEFLERSHDALVFIGPSAMGDYLPAFLMAVLRRAPALAALPAFLVGVLTRGGDLERFRARFSSLTLQQCRVVANALATLEAIYEPGPRRRPVTEALDSYWRPLIQHPDERGSGR